MSGALISEETTLLRVLVTRSHLQRYESFLTRFERAARALAEQEREPRLASTTVGGRQYERWLSGKLIGKPHPDACRVLEHMFPHTVDELFSPPAASAGGTATAGTTPAATYTQPGFGAPTLTARDVETTRSARSGEEDGTRHRAAIRELVGSVTSTLTAPALEAIEAVRRSMDATLTDGGGLDLLEEWEHRTDDYTQAYQVTPAASLLKDAVLDFSDIQSALAQGQLGRHQARAWRLSARLAGMIGICLTVLGQHRDARAWFHTGRRAAQLAEDNTQRAWMHTRAAIVSLHFGTAASALELADKAASLHRGPSGTAVRTHVVRARALARMGDRINARTALDDARTSFDLLDDEASDKVFGYTERQFLAHSSSAMTSLRDTKAASRLQEQTLAAFADHAMTEHMDPAVTQIEQGMCLLWEGDPAGACRHVIDVLSALPAEHRIGLIRVYALTFANALTPDQRRLRAGIQLEECLRWAFPSMIAS